MSPERLQDPGEVDGRADIYSVGAVAYFLLTGRQLFDGRHQMDIVFHAVNVMPDPPSEVARASVPDELNQLVMQCLAKSAANRPPNLQALIDVLDVLAETHVWTPQDARNWWNKNQAELRTTTAIASLLETLPGATKTVTYAAAAKSLAKH